jgi:hypothetical protein
MAGGGLATVALAVSAAVWLIVGFVSTGPATTVLPMAVVLLFAAVWLVIPG